jgi:tRNA(Ile2) C34 agmatinyltransferase TiaS
MEKAERFISDESLSPSWGIAAKTGFTDPPALRAFGNAARQGTVTKRDAEETAAAFGITLAGGKGVIGALAAVALRGVPREILLDPGRDVPY